VDLEFKFIKIMRKIINLITIFILFFKMNAQNLDKLYVNATTNVDYSSYFTVNENEIITDSQLKKWINKNSNLFNSIDSISTLQTQKWFWGSSKTLISKVNFVKSENTAKRKFYFAEIARKKEEARQAEIRRQEELRRQEQERIRIENERLARIKSEIENGTFTGSHYYDYPEGRYTGDFVNGKREGFGTQDKGDGNLHKGNYYRGLPNGKGTERIKSSDLPHGLRIYGEWINGKKHGKFDAEYGLLIALNKYEIYFNNDVKVSDITKVSSDYSDFLTSSSDDSSSNNSNSSTSNNKKEKCEKEALAAYKSITVKKEDKWIKYALLTAEDKMIYFSDGYEGKIYREHKDPVYSIAEFTAYYEYTNYTYALQALYIYKRCGVITKIGRK